MSQPAPDADLLAAEAELQALVVEIEALNALWPAAVPATRRAKIGGCLYPASSRFTTGDDLEIPDFLDPRKATVTPAVRASDTGNT